MKPAILAALEELDETLHETHGPSAHPKPLYIIGGAAPMLLHSRKTLGHRVTDIDYLGDDMDPSVKAVVERVGMKHNLGRSFLNNDLGGDALEHLEFCVGKLTFVRFATMKFFDVHVLSETDILKLKVYALDTCIMSRRDDDHSEFERAQDYADIKDIAEKNGLSTEDIRDLTQNYTICQKEVYSSIEGYIINGHNRYVDDRL